MFLLNVRTEPLQPNQADELGRILATVNAELGRGARDGTVRRSDGIEVGSWFIEPEDP